MPLKIPNFTIKGLRRELRRARRITVTDQTIKLTPASGSPPEFEHYWTIKRADTLGELNKEIDETKKYAERRLKTYAKRAKAGGVPGGDITGWERIYNEWKRGGWGIEVTDEITEFVNYKEALPEIEERLEEAEEVIRRFPKRRRSEASREVNKITENLEEYGENLDKLRANAEFEETTRGVWTTTRVRTGRNVWYDEEGKEHIYRIFRNTVTHIFRGRRVSMPKSTALRYYRENRLG